jgi:hypothetical protein
VGGVVLAVVVLVLQGADVVADASAFSMGVVDVVANDSVFPVGLDAVADDSLLSADADMMIRFLGRSWYV